MSNEQAEYTEALNHLKGTEEFDGSQMSRVEIWKKLRTMARESGEAGGRGSLAQDQYVLMLRLDEKIDRIRMGVLLRDKHMLPNVQAYNKLRRLHTEYRDTLWQIEHIQNGQGEN